MAIPDGSPAEGSPAPATGPMDLRIPPSRPIVVLTGAGLSKESGLDTFRDADGIWARVRLEDVATPEAFLRDATTVHGFYNARRRTLRDPSVLPNAAHLALAELERVWPSAVLIVTQNIDDLHERAGSKNLVHMHGELLKARCTRCETVFAWHDDISTDRICPACMRSGGLRPHIVWFGEIPLEMDRIYDALEGCGLFLSIGTSGTVYPAAGFVHEASRHGIPSIELNLEPSAGASLFDRSILGPATEVVPTFVRGLLHGLT